MLLVSRHRLDLQFLRIVFVFGLNLLDDRLYALHFAPALVGFEQQRKGNHLDENGDKDEGEPVAEVGMRAGHFHQAVYHFVVGAV